MLNIPSSQAPYLRVGFVVPSLNMGGAERWFLSLIKNLRSCQATALGFVGDLWHPALADEAAHGCKLYTRTNIGRGECLGSLQAVVDRVASECDVLVSWAIMQSAECYAGLRVPVVDVSHNEADFPEQRPLCAKTWLGANFVVGVSEASLMAYPVAAREQGGAVIYNGAEVDRVCPRRGRAGMRQQCGIPEDGKVALFLSRMVWQKHPEILLEALSLLPDNWYGAFVGDGPNKQELQAAAGRSLKNRVFFFPATVHIGDFFAMADVWTLPSEFEGHPITLAEAWLAGIPSVLTDIPIAREMEAMHKQPCFYKIPMVPDAAVLAAAMTQAATDGRNSEIVRNARAVAWNYYTASAMAFRWETYLIQVAREWQNNSTYTPAMLTTKNRPLRELTN